MHGEGDIPGAGSSKATEIRPTTPKPSTAAVPSCRSGGRSRTQGLRAGTARRSALAGIRGLRPCRLEASIEEADGDAAFVAKALGDIARARGMAQVASDTGLSRESLYKALSGERVSTFDTVLRVVGALGLKLRAEAASAVQRRSG